MVPGRGGCAITFCDVGVATKSTLPWISRCLSFSPALGCWNDWQGMRTFFARWPCPDQCWSTFSCYGPLVSARLPRAALMFVRSTLYLIHFNSGAGYSSQYCFLSCEFLRSPRSSLPVPSDPAWFQICMCSTGRRHVSGALSVFVLVWWCVCVLSVTCSVSNCFHGCSDYSQRD